MINVNGLNRRYVKIAGFINILAALCVICPWIKIEDSNMNGFGFISYIVSNGIDTSSFFRGLAPIILLVLSMGMAIVLMAHPMRGTAYGLIGFDTATILFLIQEMFGMRSLLSANYNYDSFLIRNFNIGYWFALILILLGLIYSMKSAKIDPGYIVLVVMSVVWLFPIFYIVMNSLRGEGNFYVNYLIPKEFSLDNYKQLLSSSSKFHYGRWFLNTFIVSVFSCVISTLIVLATAYTISRIRFKGRKLIMNLLLVLGMFPAFMSMIAVYYILKGIGIAQSLLALVIVYSASAALTYYVAKGFFDTIPRALDEAAYLDGASKWTVFTKITIPISKPIIIYTILTSFTAPWADYIFASVILGDKSDKYTIAMGLYGMLTQDNIDKYFKQFAAGAVLISIPIAALFISLQKYYVEGLSGSVKG
ncbi:arabinogalactan oligomer / maltooligosaccharide transport system permease protein [Pseudobutyrivibrio sp. JW11]|uniref:sugar ABC transporter permease n=1 Tax=Pseudobutyrivibrio sp. JW11 TaxID=1855302 RepID=UPI0008E8AC72|nr:sugar ABC transporter permease [Pseudobutyrivibrio sp. JW11]SFO32079.1 arabinogalactan oligomer / maltooligosaccharide transport system permease protein [Pseudobutyrivibrio sp. JW11]